MRRVVAALGAVLILAFANPQARQELPGWFELPVPGGVATLEALAIPAAERAITLPILARAVYDRDTRVGLTPGRVFALLNAKAAPSAGNEEAITIPLPLDAKAWWQLLPQPNRGDLFARLVSDRNATLTAIGLIATDDSVRAWLAHDRALLKFIYQHASGAFAVVARRLQLANGRLVVPGGPQADVIWHALAGEAPSRPVPFVRALLTKDAGRLAWYFDTMAGLDPERLAAAWPRRNTDDAEALYASFRDSDPQWRLQDQPFRRGLPDAWTIVTQVDLAGTRPASVLSQELWSAIFAGDRLTASNALRLAVGAPRGTVPWLTREILAAQPRDRRERYELFRLAQRVFPRASATDAPQIGSALARLRDFRALLFALERMHIRDVATWTAMAEAATHVAENADDRKESLAAFQATLAIIERIRHVRTIDANAAGQLLRSLSKAVQTDDHVIRSLSTWIVDDLVRSLPPLIRPDAFTGKTAYESTILQALAGPLGTRADAKRLDWEGLTYTVDIAAAEHDRLRAMRALLPSPGLDEAIRTARPRDVANALTALVYATALGDPDGPASLSPDVVTRHEFGFGGTSIIRQEIPWSPPEERQGFGPWHVQGALLGLDLGLSRLTLRRVTDEEMPQAPTLTLNDLGTLTRTAVALVPAELNDRERDEIAAAIERGRTRVRDAGNDVAAVSSLAREARLSEAVRQLIPWIVTRQKESTLWLFSLRALLWLGRPALTPAELDHWGVAADGLDGRRITAMPEPAPWEDFSGRSEAGQVTTQVPDLTLRLVEETARLKLPAILVPALLSFALQDYWHEVQMRFADDWPQLTRHAAALPSQRIQDYVAALTGNGPLRAQ